MNLSKGWWQSTKHEYLGMPHPEKLRTSLFQVKLFQFFAFQKIALDAFMRFLYLNILSRDTSRVINLRMASIPTKKSICSMLFLFSKLWNVLVIFLSFHCQKEVHSRKIVVPLFLTIRPWHIWKRIDSQGEDLSSLANAQYWFIVKFEAIVAEMLRLISNVAEHFIWPTCIGSTHTCNRAPVFPHTWTVTLWGAGRGLQKLRPVALHSVFLGTQ